jgi:uncharacterized protein YegP (UPF0339 family)
MPTSNDHVKVFRGNDGRWYWHRQAGNGQIVSTGGQGYDSESAARAAAQRNNPGIPIL